MFIGRTYMYQPKVPLLSVKEWAARIVATDLAFVSLLYIALRMGWVDPPIPGPIAFFIFAPIFCALFTLESGRAPEFLLVALVLPCTIAGVYPLAWLLGITELSWLWVGALIYFPTLTITTYYLRRGTPYWAEK